MNTQSPTEREKKLRELLSRTEGRLRGSTCPKAVRAVGEIKAELKSLDSKN